MILLEVAEVFHDLLLPHNEEERRLFEQLYKEHREEMFYTAYIVLENKYDAEDIVHDSFVAVLNNMDKLIGNTPERNWNYIVTIVKHKAYNLYNKKKRHEEEQLTDKILKEMVDVDLETRILELELEKVLEKLILQLPEGYRDVLLLQYYHRLDYVEIAKIMGKTPDNIRHMSMRAKRKIQQMLAKRGFFGGI